MVKLRPWLTALWLASTPLFAASYYVAPSGTSSGNGSKLKPWDLATALAQPATVKPGDTIWLTGGTYVGHFTSKLKGSTREPIVVRQADGERAILDGNDGTNTVTLLVNGSDAWYWGFEIMNSSTARLSNSSSANPPGQGEGVNLLGPRTRLINLVIHDTSQGVLTTTDIADTEISGCLIYYNGYDGPDRGHGHGVYIQNAAPSTKHVLDNIIFAQYGYGIHAYTEGGVLDNLDIEGNTSFNNGILSKVSSLTTDILVGANGSAAAGPSASAKVAKNTVLRNNYTYFTSGGTASNLGFSKGIASPTITDNYFVGSAALTLVNAFPPITMQGNAFFGKLSGFTSSDFPNNTYYSSRPSGTKVFIRPNKYELGRANITIYNWDNASSVDIDPSAIVKVGARYELRNAQNYFAPPVASGIYPGGVIHVPMTGLAPATPVGLATPAPTGPEFQVFVLVQTSPTTSARGRIGRSPDRDVVHTLGDRSMVMKSASGPEASGPKAVDVPSTVAAVPASEPCAVALPSEPSAASADSQDASSSDRTHTSLYPVARSETGLCRASLTATNSGLQAAGMRVTYLEHETDNTNAAAVSVVLNPGASWSADDVLESAFGLREGHGTLEVEADDGIHVSVLSRGSSATSSDPAPLAAVSTGELSPLRTLRGVAPSDAAFTDVRVINPNFWGGPVAITLQEEPSVALATAFLVVPPRSDVRRGLTSLFGPLEVPADTPLSLVVDGGALPIYAFTSTRAPGSPRRTDPAAR